MQLTCVIIVLSAVLVKRGYSEAVGKHNFGLQQLISHLENACQDGQIPQEYCSERIERLKEQMQQNINSLQFSSSRRTDFQRANSSNPNTFSANAIDNLILKLKRVISHLENACQDGQIPQEYCSELKEQMQQNINSLQFSSSRRTDFQRANNNPITITNNLSPVFYQSGDRNVEINDNGNGRKLTVNLHAQSGSNGKDTFYENENMDTSNTNNNYLVAISNNERDEPIIIYNNRRRQSLKYLNQSNRSIDYKNENHIQYNRSRYPTNTRSNGKPIKVNQDEPHTPLYVYSNNRTLNTNTTRNSRPFTPVHNVPSNNNINHSNIDTTRLPKNPQDGRSKFYRNFNLTRNESYITKDKGFNGTTTPKTVSESITTSTEQSKRNEVNTEFMNAIFDEADEYRYTTTEESMTPNSDYLNNGINETVSSEMESSEAINHSNSRKKKKARRPNTSNLEKYMLDEHENTANLSQPTIGERNSTHVENSTSIEEKTTNTSVIVGTVSGVVLFCALVVAGIAFFKTKRKKPIRNLSPLDDHKARFDAYADTRPVTYHIYENIENIHDTRNIDNPDYVYDNAYEYRTFHNPKLDITIYETITCKET